MNEDRIEAIRERLNERFCPTALDIIDESHLHAGHPGARDGRGHFRVRIVSAKSCGLPRLVRHRRVYEALGELMDKDIHALTIEAHSE